jgi:hypothetical protein
VAKTPPDDNAGNPGVDFHGERRSNATHQSTADPAARLSKKSTGGEAKLAYAGHVLMENRSGLAVAGCVTQAGGRAEPQAALALAQKIPGWRRVTLGADKGYDRKERDRQITPHRARKPTSVIDQRAVRHPGCAVSRRKRKRVEEVFGWLKTVGGPRKTRHRGVARGGRMFAFALAAYPPGPDAQAAAGPGMIGSAVRGDDPSRSASHIRQPSPAHANPPQAMHPMRLDTENSAFSASLYVGGLVQESELAKRQSGASLGKTPRLAAKVAASPTALSPDGYAGGKSRIARRGKPR